MLRILGIKSSRGTALIVNLGVLSIFWWYLFTLELGYSYAFVISAVPYWFLVSFGCYALWKIGAGLYRLRDCNDDSLSLEKEIKEAKEFYKKKGLKSY